MSSANVDLVRSIYAAWERGDFSSVEWAHPEIEYVWVGGPAPRTWTGLAGMAEGNREFLSAWEGVQIGADEYRQLDDERVLVLADYTGRGKRSGLELGRIAGNGTALFHIHDSKVTRLVIYWDRNRALADLGLSPEPDAPGS